MPNKVKPHALKLLQGTVRADRDTAPKVELPVPERFTPPDWLTNPDALAEWHRLVAVLSPVRVLTVGEMSNLAHFCHLHGSMVTKCRMGETPSAAEYTQLRIFATEFGLTPASRHKIAPTEKGENTNPFARLEEGAA